MGLDLEEMMKSRSPMHRVGCGEGPAVDWFPLLLLSLAPVTTVWSSESDPSQALLRYDNLGNLVATPKGRVPSGLLPADATSLRYQIPRQASGTTRPKLLEDRLEAQREDEDTFTWFPRFHPRLGPYIAAPDAIGNTALRPGGLIPTTPDAEWIQALKYRVSDCGLNYSLVQTLTYLAMDGMGSGDSALGFYTLDWVSKWTAYSTAHGEEAGWISSQVKVMEGIGSARNTTVTGSLGSLVNPASLWTGRNGVEVSEMAWQQSLAGGRVVAVAGVINASNYLDLNTYANTARGQFLNSAFVNSMVVPLPAYTPAVNLQWQPTRSWYVMNGTTIGGIGAGRLPWVGWDAGSWSSVLELGYVAEDLLGLGSGVYRVQPFVAQQGQGKAVGAGVGLNFQQRLGPNTPLGWFGRFGMGGIEGVSSAANQVATGVIVQAPLKHLGLITGQPNDGMGLGVCWSEPFGTGGGTRARNETAVELGYCFHLTPLVRIQPDVQFVIDPAYNANRDTAVVFQLQLDVNW